MMRIALIDDNRTVLTITEVMLKKERYIKDEDVINKFNEIKDLNNITIDHYIEEYDLIICDQDLGVGKVNGLDFLKKIVDRNPSVICVLLTGDDSLLMKAKTAISKNINYLIKNNDGTIHKLGEIINTIRKEI